MEACQFKQQEGPSDSSPESQQEGPGGCGLQLDGLVGVVGLMGRA
jgi:hypothetical protein